MLNGFSFAYYFYGGISETFYLVCDPYVSYFFSKGPSNSESGKRYQQEQSGVPGNECCVCREGTVDCAILNCGHICCCERCAKRLSSCPVCRQSIDRIIRLYPV
ncbi:unnamed protein product [Calicophoron daubneyi]|uniref:RING-type domain-containing protein n=1 Tax=Calicophoron daubneyi TaxID=300641 RepID=A0AAV2TRN6_CALDB